MKTLYAVTHINRDGMRQLTWPNQGRYHYETPEMAQKWISDATANNSPENLSRFFGPQAIGTFEVRPVECYDNGDAVRIFFD